MIRLIKRRLIIPRGDTGSFSIPVLKDSSDNIAVFTIFDEVTQTKILQKKVKSNDSIINIAFTHADTVNLKPGEYVWDIKYYSNPEYIDDELVNGEEIDSYYAGFSLPVCEIRETADNYLVSPEAPTATLSPQQLEIVTSAIHSLNEAIRKTQENVEHYPEIRDEVWYTWDAELGDYASTGVRANGIVGNGIESAVLNNDYTLTLNFTDGTSFTSPSIQGETGNGIDDIVLNNDFTLTISYTDGGSYTTPSIRGPVGATPQFSIGNVQDGATAAATITGTAENPVLNLTLPNAHVPTKVSQLENDSGYLTQEVDPTVPQWAKEPTKPSYTPQEIGALPINTFIPTKVSDLEDDSGHYTKPANGIPAADLEETYLTSFTETDPTVPSWAKQSTKPNYTPQEVGALPADTYIPQKTSDLTNDSNYAVDANYVHTDNNYTTAEKNKLSGIAAGAEVNVNADWNANSGDAQILNKPINVSAFANDVGYLTEHQDLSDYVQKTDYATANNAGVVKINNSSTNSGIGIDSNGYVHLNAPYDSDIKTGNEGHVAVTLAKQHSAAFYGLAKAAGDTTQSQSSNAVGIYTNEAKAAIQTMLDVPSTSDIPTQVSELTNDVGYLTSFTEIDPTVPTWAKAAQKPSYTAAEVGAPTIAEMNTAIGIAIGNINSFDMAVVQALPTQDISTHTIYLVPKTGETNDVYDEYVYINNNWEMIGNTQIDLNNYVQKTDYANVNSAGVVKTSVSIGILSTGAIGVIPATNTQIKASIDGNNPIVSSRQHASTFYGLAKAAGDSTQSQSNNQIGQYTDDAKAAIQQMLDVPAKSDIPTKVSDLTDDSGHYTKPSTGIPASDLANGVIPEVPVQDVQINNVSALNAQGIVNIPVAGSGVLGVIMPGNGVYVNAQNQLSIDTAVESDIKNGTTIKLLPVVRQHVSTFYGLSKVAGVDLANENVTVGIYPEASKIAIKTMLGVQEGLEVVRLI